MSFNLWTFLLEALNFLVLAVILQRLLYRPLHRAIDQRRAAVAQAQAEAEAARQQATALQQQLAAQLGALDQQRQQALAQAHEQAAADRERLLAEAARDAQQLREEARAALAREREEALNALGADAAAVALDLAARLLREACDANVQQQLARRLIEALERLPAEERARLRAEGPAGAGAVIETAQELDNVTLAQINAAIAALLGHDVALDVTVTPALLGGLRARLDGHLWDSSLAGQLEEAHHAGSARSD